MSYVIRPEKVKKSESEKAASWFLTKNHEKNRCLVPVADHWFSSTRSDARLRHLIETWLVQSPCQSVMQTTAVVTTPVPSFALLSEEKSSPYRGSCQSCSDRSCVRVEKRDALVSCEPAWGGPWKVKRHFQGPAIYSQRAAASHTSSMPAFSRVDGQNGTSHRMHCNYLAFINSVIMTGQRFAAFSVRLQ